MDYLDYYYNYYDEGFLDFLKRKKKKQVVAMSPQEKLAAARAALDQRNQQINNIGSGLQNRTNMLLNNIQHEELIPYLESLDYDELMDVIDICEQLKEYY